VPGNFLPWPVNENNRSILLSMFNAKRPEFCGLPHHARRTPEYAPPMTRALRSLLCGAAVGLCFGAAAQSDSTPVIYRDIHEYSLKHKVTRWIYSGIFVEPIAADEPPPSAPRTQRSAPFRADKGKIVRHIEVRTMDPFGFSVDDTTQAPVNGLQTWANRLHRKTRPRIVRNLLLVKPLRPLDPLQVSESERVLRATPFVTDARILVQPVAGTKDSVDLLVMVHDKWSIDVSGEADLTSASATVREKNLLGWGQSVEQRVGYLMGQPKLSLSGAHQVYNIRNSFISSYAHYATGPDGDELGFSFQRPFYSPLAKWAAGVAWSQGWSRYQVFDTEGAVLSDHALSPATLDIWTGRGFHLGDGTEPGSQNSNFVLAARYAQTRYATRPPRALDPLGVYSDNSLFLVSTGISIRQYYKERYLFRFGNAEDVPEGLLLTFTTGVEKRELTVNRPYVGADVSRGRNYAGFGYLNVGLGYGTFFQTGDVVDGALNMRVLYFTDLRNWGRWHFRQFFRFNAVYGYNKPDYASVNLNGSQLYGFSSGTLTGTHKELFRSETVFYAPWSFLGFKVAPVLLAGFGTLGGESDPLFSGRIQTAVTLGLLVRNENLLVNTFELSVGFYPYLPDTHGAGFRFNSFDSFSAGAPGFDFGEPAEVPYD
jgi:hypothetical protein